jgi:predicted peptidase
VVVLAPGSRVWVIIDSFPTFFAAMVMATGQPPYGENWRLVRTLTLRWI